MEDILRLVSIVMVLAVVGMGAMALRDTLMTRSSLLGPGDGLEFRIEDYPGLQQEVFRLTALTQTTRNGGSNRLGVWSRR